MAEKNIPVTRGERAPASWEETRMLESFLRPPVNIFEDDEKLTLMADLPGVDKDRLDINIEQGLLTIKGTAQADEQGESLYREFVLGNYYRQFQLPEEIDQEKCSADLSNGTLHMTLAKSEKAKPRRIEITTH